jgi:hypothetical protein
MAASRVPQKADHVTHGFILAGDGGPGQPGC